VDEDLIKRFVRNTLHCTCPDEVFEHIECEAAVKTRNGPVLDYEINVGNRLLIYVVRVREHQDTFPDKISQLVRLGTNKRDACGFNRFRLVLLATNPGSMEERASEIFSPLVLDERVHLHVISDDQFDQTP
jgi:hypothetical protein